MKDRQNQMVNDITLPELVMIIGFIMMATALGESFLLWFIWNYTNLFLIKWTLGSLLMYALGAIIMTHGG